MIEQLTGKIGGMVFCRAHTGQHSLIKSPDRSHVEWSQAQKGHRVRFGQAAQYAKAAIADPEICPIYERMVAERKESKRLIDSFSLRRIMSIAVILAFWTDNDRTPSQ